MLNSYLLLGLTVFWLASVAGAFYKGYARAEDKMRAAYATQLEATIAEHNENALEDMVAAREAGQRDNAARVRTVTITNEVERVIQAKPSPAVCRLSDDAFRLLSAAIAVSNGTAPSAPSGLPDASPAVKPAIRP